MTTTCDLAAQSMGTGVAAALTAVDCIASEVSEAAFNRLFGSDGALAVALTILLVLYVGFFGLRLMLGRSSLSIGALLPRVITIGLVLTFATSFVAFQAVFYNLAVGGPNEIAGYLIENDGSATVTFATKLDIVFLAIQDASMGQGEISAFSPPGMMWMGAMLLLLGTVGLLVTARIGLAILLAIGPIFVVLALFNGTRGLFVGWLKGLVMLAVTPLFAVLAGSLMLELAVPILAALVAVPGQIDQQAAMAFFVVGFVHACLMLLMLVVSSKMVSGWQVFGLAAPPVADHADGQSYQQRAVDAPKPQQGATATAPAAASANRRIDIPATSPAMAANDTEPAQQNAPGRETRVITTSQDSAQVTPLNPSNSRTTGIGNRFRSSSANTLKIKPETRS